MRSKIIWLSLLSLALAKPTKEIRGTSAASRDHDSDQRQRSSRSIWPFASSATSTEAPATYPPPANDWFVNGDTALPEGIDLQKYPIWKIHKYHGIDLRPVKINAENTYPPEGVPEYPGGNPAAFPLSGSSQSTYQNGYQDFVSTDSKSAGIYPAPYPAEAPSYPPALEPVYPPAEAPSYPPAQEPVYPLAEQPLYPPAEKPLYPLAEETTYPAEVPSYNSGEFQSTDYRKQPQQQYPYPPPVEDYKPHVTYGVPEQPALPHTSYGVPEQYQVQNYPEQSNGYQHPSVGQQSPSGNGDLSFLDNLGGLADFLPEPQETTEAPGFFQSLLSKFRGTTESPVVVEESVPVEPVQSGGFLSSLFGSKQKTEQPEAPQYPSESSGSALSSLLYPKGPEVPAVVEAPKTYYLPETRGSYVAVKVPPGSPALNPNHAAYAGIPNIQIHEAPKVPFQRQEIPSISSPTLNNGYNNYQLTESEVRNSWKNPIAAEVANYQVPKNQQKFATTDVTAGVSLVQTTPNRNNNFESSGQAQIATDSFRPISAAEVANYQVPNNQQKFAISEVTALTAAGVNQVQTNPTDSFRPSAAYQIHIGEGQDQQNHKFQPSSKTAPKQTLQSPRNPIEPMESYNVLPLHEAVDFSKASSALDSYGHPTEPFVGASSNIQEVVVPEKSDIPEKESIDDRSSGSETTTIQPEPIKTTPARKLRKVFRRRYSAEKAKRSSPARQAPTEEVGSSVFRSEKDLVPEVREGRHYNGTKVSTGYSKVQQHHVVTTDAKE